VTFACESSSPGGPAANFCGGDEFNLRWSGVSRQSMRSEARHDVDPRWSQHHQQYPSFAFYSPVRISMVAAPPRRAHPLRPPLSLGALIFRLPGPFTQQRLKRESRMDGSLRSFRAEVAEGLQRMRRDHERQGLCEEAGRSSYRIQCMLGRHVAVRGGTRLLQCRPSALGQGVKRAPALRLWMRVASTCAAHCLNTSHYPEWRRHSE